MCLAVIEWQPGQPYPLKIVANRDEFRHRPTLPMHNWEQPSLLAGKDLEAGGTWLGISTQLKFALLTNIRPGYVGVKGRRSRGELVTDFLTSQESVEQFHQRLKPNLPEYGGFNLIVGDAEGLFWFSSTQADGQWLSPGIHALSNDALNTPWPKVTLAKEQMRQQGQRLCDNLTDHGILQSTNQAADQELPETGVPLAWERQLSAQTILGKDYGTLSRTHLVLNDQTCRLAEQQINELGEVVETREFQWVREIKSA